MTRSKFWRAVVVVVVAILVLAACKKEKPEDEDNNSTIEDVSIIEIRNLGSSNISKVKAELYFGNNLYYWYEVIAECTYQNGGFKMTLPPTIDKDLYQIVNIWGHDGVEISDSSARMSEGISLYAYSSAERGNIGRFSLENDNNTIGFYAYADRDFTVNGKFYNVYDSSYTTEVNGSFKKGWNTVYRTYYDQGATISTQKPSGIKWVYWSDNGAAIRYKKENPDTKCSWVGLSRGGNSQFSHYFGTSSGTSSYKVIYESDWNIVYSESDDINGFIQSPTTAISNYYFEEGKSYTVVCSDDGNGNSIFNVIEDGQKSLSLGSEHSPTMLFNGKQERK